MLTAGPISLAWAVSRCRSWSCGNSDIIHRRRHQHIRGETANGLPFAGANSGSSPGVCKRATDDKVYSPRIMCPFVSARGGRDLSETQQRNQFRCGILKNPPKSQSITVGDYATRHNPLSDRTSSPPFYFPRMGNTASARFSPPISHPTNREICKISFPILK